MVPEVLVDHDGPASCFKLGDGCGAKPRPVEVGGAVVGLGEKGGGFVGEVAVLLTFCGYPKHEAEGGLRGDGGEPEFGKLLESAAFESGVTGEGSFVGELGEGGFVGTVLEAGAGDEPHLTVLLAQGLQEEAGDLGGDRLGGEVEVKGGFVGFVGRNSIGQWGRSQTSAPSDGPVFFLVWAGLAEETGEGVGFGGEKEDSSGVGAVVGVIATAGGVEVPLRVILGPEVDFNFLLFARCGELDGAVFGLVESEVGEEGLLRELLSHHKNMLVEAVQPRLLGEEGLEGFAQEEPIFIRISHFAKPCSSFRQSTFDFSTKEKHIFSRGSRANINGAF